MNNDVDDIKLLSHSSSLSKCDSGEDAINAATRADAGDGTCVSVIVVVISSSGGMGRRHFLGVVSHIQFPPKYNSGDRGSSVGGRDYSDNVLCCYNP